MDENRIDAGVRKNNSRTPVIGVTVDVSEKESDTAIHGFPEAETILWLKKRYTDAIEASGGAVILIPFSQKRSVVKTYLDLLDGLVITGGDFDLDPALYGEKKMAQCGELKPERTKMELALYNSAHKMGIPILGVCGGMQVINIAHGGTLFQDISFQRKGSVRHEQKPIPSTKPSHTVSVEKNSLLAKITKKATLKVNSTHHQAVKDVGKGFVATGVAPDGIVEAIEPVDKGGAFLLGIQWHPELLFDLDEPSVKIYKRFVSAAKKYRAELS